MDMAVHVLEEESRAKIDAGTPAVLLESDITEKKDFHLAIRELQHADARHAAIAAATRMGVANARVGFPEAPFPIDADGEVVVRPTEQEVVKYRTEIPITAKAV
jgi:hypothetical protein